jgi:hypothetical protein
MWISHRIGLAILFASVALVQDDCLGQPNSEHRVFVAECEVDGLSFEFRADSNTSRISSDVPPTDRMSEKDIVEKAKTKLPSYMDAFQTISNLRWGTWPDCDPILCKISLKKNQNWFYVLEYRLRHNGVPDFSRNSFCIAFELDGTEIVPIVSYQQSFLLGAIEAEKEIIAKKLEYSFEFATDRADGVVQSVKSDYVQKVKSEFEQHVSSATASLTLDVTSYDYIDTQWVSLGRFGGANVLRFRHSDAAESSTRSELVFVDGSSLPRFRYVTEL